MTRRRRNAEMVDDRREQVRYLHRDGLNTAQIARTLGWTTRTVMRDKAALGLDRQVHRPFTEAEADRAREMLAEGMHYAEIARTLGRSDTCIRLRFPGHALSPQQTAQLAAMGRWWARLERTR